jgi:hypothetical protein
MCILLGSSEPNTYMAALPDIPPSPSSPNQKETMIYGIVGVP